MYNCHSYAWYLQSASNNITILSSQAKQIATEYLSYDPTTNYSSASVGDIVAYYKWDNSHTELTLNHSAVIESLSTTGDYLNTIVKSKWAAAGLYEHHINACPYFSNAIIVFYKRCTHSSWSITPTNVIGHTCTCNACGFSHFVEHTVNQLTGRCTICGMKVVSVYPQNNEEIG